MKNHNENILAFIDWYSPGYKAGGITTAFVNFVAHMKNYHTFYIITRNSDYTSGIPYAGIVPDTWTKKNENEYVFYASEGSLNRADLKKIFSAITYDTIYINGIYSFWFSIYPAWHFRKSEKKVLVDPHGMLSGHALAVKSTKKDLFVKVSNLIHLYKNVTFHVADSNEAKAVEGQIKKYKEIKVAWQLPKKIYFQSPESRKKGKEIRLVSIARISPEKNTHYLLKVLLKYTRGPLELDIYGPVYNSEYWDECRDYIMQMPSNIKVSYKGPVESNKVQNVLKEYHFMFLPSTGENFGHIILESLQAGCPVIISDRTPWRNLEEKGVGWDIPLDQPNKFTEVIEYCARMGQEEYNTMSQKAFEYAKKVTEDPEVIEANKRLFE